MNLRVVLQLEPFVHWLIALNSCIYFTFEMHGAQGILESLEAALKSGFRPKRTFYISFGHYEEVPHLLSSTSLVLSFPTTRAFSMLTWLWCKFTCTLMWCACVLCRCSAGWAQCRWRRCSRRVACAACSTFSTREWWSSSACCPASRGPSPCAPRSPPRGPGTR